MLAAMAAGPSPPPVMADTAMLDTSVLGVRLEIEYVVLWVVSVDWIVSFARYQTL